MLLLQAVGKLLSRREGTFKQASCHGLDPSGALVTEWDYLNNFFKRYNKVSLLDPVLCILIGKPRPAWDANTKQLESICLVSSNAGDLAVAF